MGEPKNVLYFAENALSAIQGGGIVAYAVLKGLPPERLLGFFEYRNITPVPEYADRFTYLGGWRTPRGFERLNRLTRGRFGHQLRMRFAERYLQEDFAVVKKQVTTTAFAPEVVYFAGLSYRYLRLAVMAAEYYDVPMVLLHMDDWMHVDRAAVGPRWGALWQRRIVQEMTRAAARSLVSTTNSPRLAAKITAMTGYRHVPANNCCSDLMDYATDASSETANDVPVITYAGAMNVRLQGESLKVLASAVAELNAEGTRVHLHVYTPWEFAPEANAISVPGAVFYKGQVGREKLADIFRRSDFLATTVTYRDAHIGLFRHSLSTKLSEYLCAGRPVISMGHYDWHLHEYVQDNGCGFSITMDENFSRARIKEQLRRILSTEPSMLAAIGRRNRELWTRAHDVRVMAQTTRRAIGLGTDPVGHLGAPIDRRGVLWVGGPERDGGWVESAKLKAICRRLVDVFELTTVDVIGHNVFGHPELHAVLAYCQSVGLRPAVIDTPAGDRHAWDPAAAAWALDPAQITPRVALTPALDVFAQVTALRGRRVAKVLPVDRAINQLTVRLPEQASDRPVVWLYGSSAVGLELLDAIRAHTWLCDAVSIGGFVSSPGKRRADMLHGLPWRSVDELRDLRADIVVVTSETSRLAIQEELTRQGLLGRMLPMFGSAGTSVDCGYERIPSGPGQAYVEGSNARDYATRELAARIGVPAPVLLRSAA